MLKNFLFKLRNSFLPYPFAYATKILLRLLLMTCKIEIKGLDSFTKTASKSPCILMLWHDRLIILSEILQKYTSKLIYTAMISKSRDGDPLAILAQSYRRGRVIRVSHHSRYGALNRMIHHLKTRNEVILVTPDGPRGPRYVAKPGVALAAKESAAKVVPFSWSANKFWKLKTWDEMMIPKPFSKIRIVFGDPLSFSKNSDTSLQEEIGMLNSSLIMHSNL